MSPRAKETIYMCMVKVIEYKVETQTIQCHLESYSWKKGIIQVVSSKKRNSTGSQSLHIMNDCSSEGNYFAQTYQKKTSYEQS